MDFYSERTPNDVKIGFARLRLDVSEFNKYTKEASKEVQKLVKSKELLMDMAETAIYFAYRHELIPEKLEYEIRRAKSNKKMVDDKGKPIVYKTGKRKGEQRYAPFSPSQYYSYRNLTAFEQHRFEPDYNKDNHEFIDDMSYTTTTITKHKYRGVKAVHVETKEHKYKKKRTRGTGNTIKGYNEVIDTRKRKREYWQEVEGNPEYNKSYIVDIRESKTKSGKVRKTKKYYSDRPPHLNDIDYDIVGSKRKLKSQSHSVIFNNGVAQIVIKAKKPKDKRFVDEGGKQYGAVQYYGPDDGWKRTTPGTTSRWLEVAIGLPVPGDIKVQSIATGEANRMKMFSIMGDAIKEKLRSLQK